MACDIRPLGNVMAAEAIGLDLNRPLDAETRQRLHAALVERQVLCLRRQDLAPSAYVRAAEAFGEPQLQLRRASRHPDNAYIMVLASTDRDALGDGRRVVVGEYWHTDDSYFAVPAKVTMLLAKALPSSGGDTRFCNMALALERLPAATRQRLAGLRARHRYQSRRAGGRIMTRSAAEAAETPEVSHPLIRTHPESGRPALYLNPNRMESVVGLSDADSDRLLDELGEHATRPEFQYQHRWQSGDLLLWDNRSTMHRASADYPDGDLRLMHRVLLKGTVPV
ncbi:MAG: TauD/TfdA family dioxygenase [Alphaproteobacteria bacterium]|nr:TauD/TfdA family dioxygenase [Alphaproteobacteria bacterium]